MMVEDKWGYLVGGGAGDQAEQGSDGLDQFDAEAVDYRLADTADKRGRFAGRVVCGTAFCI